MGFEGFFAAMGMGELAAEDFFIAQVGLLAATVLLFIFCLVLSFISFRAAGSARQARAEAETQTQFAQDLAVEVRHLTAQVENAATRYNAGASRAELRLEGGSAPEASIRVGAREETPEAEVELVSEENWREDTEAHPDRPDAGLDAAREAASVPSSLLTGFLRRR